MRSVAEITPDFGALACHCVLPSTNEQVMTVRSSQTLVHWLSPHHTTMWCVAETAPDFGSLLGKQTGRPLSCDLSAHNVWGVFNAGDQVWAGSTPLQQQLEGGAPSSGRRFSASLSVRLCVETICEGKGQGRVVNNGHDVDRGRCALKSAS